MGKTLELLYVRWRFDTVQASARAFNRAILTEQELRGPFKAYRWSVFPGSRFVGHPPTGAPNFGVVDVSSVVYAAPLVHSLEDAHDAADPLYRLNTDAWESNSVCVLICLFQRVTADFSIYVKSEIG